MHWKLKRILLKFRRSFLPTPQEETLNLVINESMKSSIAVGSADFHRLMKRIKIDIGKGKTIVTCINGEPCRLSSVNGRLIIEKVRFKKKEGYGIF
jgi:hypothetical protein